MDKAGVEVIVRPVKGLPGPKEREYEQLIRGVSSPCSHAGCVSQDVSRLLLCKVLENVLLLSLHPRCMFTVVIQAPSPIPPPSCTVVPSCLCVLAGCDCVCALKVLEEDGGALAVALNAAILALLDAGAPMQVLCAACIACSLWG